MTDSWNVLEHSPLEPLADTIWRVEGSLPNMALRRHMIVIRLDDRLVIHSAIAINEKTRAELEELGEPAILVVPSGYHRMDAPAYKARYPDIQVVCPEGARSKIEKVVSVDRTYADIESTDVLKFEHLSGVAKAEGVLTVQSEDGVTLVFNDALFNHPHVGGFGGLILRLLGSSGGPKVTPIAKTFVVKDKAAYADHLRRLADIPNLTRVIPGHGDIILNDPAVVLRNVADQL